MKKLWKGVFCSSISPSVLPDQIHETAPAEILPFQVFRIFRKAGQFQEGLGVTASHGDYETAADGKLFNQNLWESAARRPSP